MNDDDLKNFLDEQADKYNHPDFILNDPIQIPHRFTTKQDVEIAGFLTAIISWGNRKSIIKSAEKFLTFMDNSPYEFVQNATAKDLKSLHGSTVHRTFSGEDLAVFIYNLKRIYSENNSMEEVFKPQEDEYNFYHALHRFRENFLGENKIHRSSKHISATYKNSAAKRLMMFLRWMVRQDNKGVDFGFWTDISPSKLSVPLDVHTANISRKLGIIQRKQNDWKTVEQLDVILRKFNPDDPAKYDFALFGLGVSGDF